MLSETERELIESTIKELEAILSRDREFTQRFTINDSKAWTYIDLYPDLRA